MRDRHSLAPSISEMAIENLTQDLVMEILLLLPVKSLVRFKSVCKNWYSLIQNPSFISLHHHRAAKNAECLLVKRSLDVKAKRKHGCEGVGMILSLVPNEPPIEDIDISSTGLDIEALQMLGPCNGIVCLTSFGSTIVLCNPSMKDFRVLPQPSYKRDHTCILGFGFDPITNNYKVVRFSIMNNISCVRVNNSGVRVIDEKVEIYDLSTDSWRDVDAESPVKSGFYCSGHLSVSCNGDFFWYANCYRPYGRDSGAAIIAFSMTNEVFKEMPVPEVCLLDRHSYKKLFLLKDSLALAVYQKQESQNRALFFWELCFDIWVMNEEDVEVSWTRKFTVGPFQGIYKALGFRQNGEFLVGSSRGQMSCNLDTGERKKYQVHDESHARLSFLQVLVYTESLVSVKRLSEHDELVES